MVKEADWKKFRTLIPMLRERYLAHKNSWLANSLTEADRTETERFWDTLKRMEEIGKELRHCLDDINQSNMEMTMLLMLRYGMLVRDDLVEFSDELNERLQSITSRK